MSDVVMTEKLLNVSQVATELNISKKTVYQYIKEGLIITVDLPVIRIHPQEIQRIKGTGIKDE